MNTVKKVLLVEDDEMDNIIHSKIIKKINFAEEIIVKDSAEEALKFLKGIGDGLWPDIIFLDLNMPRMNGFQFVEAFLKIPNLEARKCIIVIVSSSLNPEDKSKAKEYSVVADFFTKPLDKEQLQKIIDSNFFGRW